MGFCVKCGKKGIKGSLCEECDDTDHSLLEDFKEIEGEFCRECNAYRLQGRWHDIPSLTQAIKNVTANTIKVKSGSKPRIKPLIEENVDRKSKKKIKVEVQIENQIYDIPAKIIFTECPRCSKKRSAYFEAILQIRHPNQDILDFVAHRVDTKKKAGIFVTDIKEVPNGIDYYLTSKKYAMHLGKLLQKRFFGIYKTSAKLFSQDSDTQKGIHRVSVLFRALDIERGEIVEVGEDKIKILEIRGERIQGINIANKKKVFVDINRVQKSDKNDL